jgi:hypothetical protein
MFVSSNYRRFEREKKKPGRSNVVHEYQGDFQYGARHGEDTSTITFFYTLLGDYYQVGVKVTHQYSPLYNNDKNSPYPLRTPTTLVDIEIARSKTTTNQN